MGLTVDRPSERPTHFFLLNYTEAGFRTLKRSPERLRRANQLVRKLGATCRFYLTLGSYDIVGLITAPDDRVAAKLALALSSLGTVRVTVLKAWNLSNEEYARFLKDIG